MSDPIPASALSAAALAIEAQPAGSSAAHLARVALEAAVPLLCPGGTDTQWGVSFGDAASIPRGPVQRYCDEDDAEQAKREVEALDPSHHGTVVSRQAWTGPWTPVPGEEEEHG